MNQKSRLFKTVSQHQLMQCCRRYLKEELVSAKLLEGGLFNTTYRLETAERSAILRLGPVNREYLLPYEQRLMDAEAMVQELLRAHGVNTSRTIAMDNTRTFLDRDIMVVECIPGVSLSTVEVPRNKEKEINLEAGRLTRKIHEITPQELPRKFEKPFGRIGSILEGCGGSTWSEALRREISLWRAQSEKISLFSSQEFDRFQALYEKFSPLLDAGCTAPVLVHGDLWAGNLLVDSQGNLLAVIDCDRAIFGDPEFEFATGWLAGEDFCKGYGRWPDPSEKGILRRRLYKLLLNLEDCYVHLGEYNQPEEGHALCNEVRKELEALEAI